MNIPRFLRTIRHLRPAQIYGRLLFKLPQPPPSLDPAPGRRPVEDAWVRPAPRRPALTSPQEIVLLNHPGSIAGPGCWNDPSQSHLWLYNLHYLDELAAPQDDVRRGWGHELLARWIAENPPVRGVGWEPYPASVRLVNGVKWCLSGEPTPAAFLHSMAVHARWIARRLERHLLGNHLLVNAKALVFAGLFFEGQEANGWLRLGVAVLRRELGEQLLADGGHFERSPMYHALILEDLLDLLNLARAFGQDGRGLFPELADRIQSMRRWLGVMSHPDGEISFFNDAAFGVAARPAELEAYAMRLGLPEFAPQRGAVTRLAASGYVRADAGQACAILDIAPVGPDYLPGHAHADTLSFELSVGAERIIVNGGVSTYAPGAQRQFERGTAAHSTVEVDGLDSSEVWSSFRVGRRARVTSVTISEREKEVLVEATHDGYRWRPGRPLHRRRWSLADGCLTVMDAVVRGEGRGVARFHLGPGVVASAQSDGLSGALTTGSGRRIGWSASSPLKVEPGVWAPEFGRTVGTCLLVGEVGYGLTTEFRW